MTVKKNISRIEQLTVGGIVLSFFLLYFTDAPFFWYVFQSLFLFLLLAYFIVAEKHLYRVFFVGFSARIFGSLGLLDPEISQILIYVGTGFMSLFGLLILFRSIQESVKYKNFEMITFLTGIFIALSPLVFFEVPDQVLQFYNFGLCFLIFTIMYNDNLWSRYNFDEKRVLVFIVLLALIYVLTFSMKLL
ncbi:hypothetical protein RCC89_14035 [Cytophagaceae bacterium ABcell3]|nr:hypothetical protein RCC89_14035 [Cytophagaceae bacterium ABcell3]